MERHSVTYRKQPIEFELYRKDVKNVNVNIRPDMSIQVSANPDVPLDFIKDFIQSRGSWIVKTVKHFKQVEPEAQSPREYVSGESFKYLGKQLRLKVYESDTELVRYMRGFLEVHIKDPGHFKRKRKIVTRWFQARTEIILKEALETMYPQVEKYGIKKPKIMIRPMKARWGSCIKDKQIILLNSELIKAPKYCIQYVVLHELIHFRHPNHDHNFYEFLAALMPDWKACKAILDEEVVRSL
ncbi:MAG: M48 family metallopeptidase [bacterium]|nr:M48 family metallopeptidase [bacterium]